LVIKSPGIFNFEAEEVDTGNKMRVQEKKAHMESLSPGMMRGTAFIMKTMMKKQSRSLYTIATRYDTGASYVEAGSHGACVRKRRGTAF
jgi:hypothetical protein